MTLEQLQDLTSKYLAGTATEAERRLLQDWYQKGTEEELRAPLSSIHTSEEEMEFALFEKIRRNMNEQPVEVPVRRMRWTRWVAAASVLLVIGMGSWFLLSRPDSSKSSASITAQHTGTDVLPGYDGAILTTSEGSQIVLDSTGNGIIASQGKVQVSKQGGQLLYDATPATNDEVSYNTLTTPRGRKFELVLADGTQVWLDAGSSITYPTAFTGSERKVTMTGQAYFEVAKDATRPFLVNVDGRGEVQVLGTHFNVNAYGEETLIRATLVEGSVKLNSANGEGLVMKPGEQAAFSAQGPIQRVAGFDMEEVLAWKNGFTAFRQADIKTIMRLAARWYDVDVEYEGTIPARTFTADVSRNVKLSQFLQILEASHIRFQIEGRKLLVLP